MLISHSKKFIFIHVFKVAGMSIRQALSKYNHKKNKKNQIYSFLNIRPKIYSSDFQGHTKACEAKSALPTDIFNTYYKFAFVRNPWDWQVSLYHFILQQPNHYKYEETKDKSFDEFLHWWIESNCILQSDFLTDENNELLVDYVGKFENIQYDFEHICKNIGITACALTKKNTSKHKDYRKYYTSNLVDLVSETYKTDIERFGYAFE